MPQALADPPTPAQAPRPQAGDAPAGEPAAHPGGAPAARPCAACGAPLAAGQDWCLSCGAGAPGSLGAQRAGWRSAGAVLGAVAVLVLGAAAAAYAALSKGGSPRVPVRAVAAAPAVPAPATPAPAVTTPAVPGASATPKPPAALVKPPKIPLKALTPKAAAQLPAAKVPASIAPAESAPSSSPSSSAGESSPSPGTSQPEPLLLDTNAASTYNPYAYPAAGFGDPSLAIDGDSSTGWTAQLQPAVAPKMAEGLLIDLKSAKRLAAVVLVTSTPGMTIQLYGATGKTAPSSITDRSWVKLSPSMLEHKKRTRVSLRESKRAFSFVLLWISRAPASALGTPQAPGRVSVNELELLPAR